MVEPFLAWTIFKDHPNNPGKVIGVEMDIHNEAKPTGNIIIGETVEWVRNVVRERNPSLIPFLRDPSDEPSVVETWL